ncbi:hypothetical protein GQ42DRAFT_154678 [Ramicandelaber brevisporus]|nr:hypothetical protein GQ42DRAFT_154678 [Ramicandelaber brevisporus]
MALEWLLGSEGNIYVNSQTAESVLTLELRNFINSIRADSTNANSSAPLPQSVSLAKDGFKLLNLYLEELIGVLVRDVMPVNFGHAGINEVLRQLFPNRSTDMGRFAWRDPMAPTPSTEELSLSPSLGGMRHVGAGSSHNGNSMLGDDGSDTMSMYTMAPSQTSANAGTAVPSFAASIFPFNIRGNDQQQDPSSPSVPAPAAAPAPAKREVSEEEAERKLLKFLKAECTAEAQGKKGKQKKSKNPESALVNALVVTYIVSVLEFLACYVLRKSVQHVMEQYGYIPSPNVPSTTKPGNRSSLLITEEHITHVITIDHDLLVLYDRSNLEDYLTRKYLETRLGQSNLLMQTSGVLNLEGAQKMLRAELAKSRRLAHKASLTRKPRSDRDSDAASVKSGNSARTRTTVAGLSLAIPPSAQQQPFHNAQMPSFFQGSNQAAAAAHNSGSNDMLFDAASASNNQYSSNNTINDLGPVLDRWRVDGPVISGTGSLGPMPPITSSGTDHLASSYVDPLSFSTVSPISPPIAAATNSNSTNDGVYGLGIPQSQTPIIQAFPQPPAQSQQQQQQQQQQQSQYLQHSGSYRAPPQPRRPAPAIPTEAAQQYSSSTPLGSGGLLSPENSFSAGSQNRRLTPTILPDSPSIISSMTGSSESPSDMQLHPAWVQQHLMRQHAGKPASPISQQHSLPTPPLPPARNALPYMMSPAPLTRQPSAADLTSSFSAPSVNGGGGRYRGQTFTAPNAPPVLPSPPPTNSNSFVNSSESSSPAIAPQNASEGRPLRRMASHEALDPSEMIYMSKELPVPPVPPLPAFAAAANSNLTSASNTPRQASTQASATVPTMHALQAMHAKQMQDLQRQQLEQLQAMQRQQMEILQVQQRLELEQMIVQPATIATMTPTLSSDGPGDNRGSKASDSQQPMLPPLSIGGAGGNGESDGWDSLVTSYKGMDLNSTATAANST